MRRRQPLGKAVRVYRRRRRRRRPGTSVRRRPPARPAGHDGEPAEGDRRDAVHGHASRSGRRKSDLDAERRFASAGSNARFHRRPLRNADRRRVVRVHRAGRRRRPLGVEAARPRRRRKVVRERACRSDLGGGATATDLDQRAGAAAPATAGTSRARFPRGPASSATRATARPATCEACRPRMAPSQSRSPSPMRMVRALR